MIATLRQTYEVSTSGSMSGGVFLLMMLVYLAVIALFLYSNWKVWVKMGDPGWMGIVPILNVYRIFQRTRPEQAVLYTILSIVPCISIVMAFFYWSDLGKLFGKSFLHGLLTPLLAFGDATYVGPPPPRLG
ncbi:MAG: DUF5684 domain-containing protein [Acidimicrobiales bacterium]